jgi:SAM-dependent methyltransferase
MAERLVPRGVRAARHQLLRAYHTAPWLHGFHTLRLFGRDARFIPPLRLMHDGPVGYREFRDNAVEFLRHYVELGGLGPEEAVLDVGCGVGRRTYLLTSYLNARGRYEGLDVVRPAIAWCVDRYRDHPNFRFQLIDVFNDHYNPGGRCAASAYRFPFPGEHFDFVVLNSVFTHMRPEDVANYMSEIARVLRVGGRCLISMFLLNAESRRLIAAGRSTLDLRHPLGPACAMWPEAPERAIGYDEPHMLDLYARHGLTVREPIRYGSWCGRPTFLSYQDLVVAVKRRG